MRKTISLILVLFATLFLSSCNLFDGQMGSFGSSNNGGNSILSLTFQEDTKKELKNDLYENSEISLNFILNNYDLEKNSEMVIKYLGIPENNIEDVTVESFSSNSNIEPKHFTRHIKFKEIDKVYSPELSISYCYKSEIFVIKNVCIKSADSSGSCDTKISNEGEISKGGFSISDLKLTNNKFNKGKLTFKMKKSENFVLKQSCEDNKKIESFTFEIDDFEINLNGEELECKIFGNRFYQKQNNPFSITCSYENLNSDIEKSYSGILNIKLSPSYSVEKILKFGKIKILSED